MFRAVCSPTLIIRISFFFFEVHFQPGPPKKAKSTDLA